MMLKLLVCSALVGAALALGGMTGGVLTGAPVSSEETEYLDFTVKNVRKFFKENRNEMPQRIHLIGSTAQVVAGVRYEYFFLVKSATQLEICEGSVWVRPWLSRAFVTQKDNNVKCGVPTSVVDAIERTANDESNSIEYVMVSGEPEISQEASNIVVKFSLSKSTCTKEDFENGKECSVADDAEVFNHATAKLTWTGTTFDIVEYELSN